MTGFTDDLRLALRGLANAPAFTAVAIVTLALGIGANTAIFSVVDAVLLAPLPYPEAHRLVAVQATAGGDDDRAFSPATFLDLARDAGSYAALGGYTSDNATLTGDGAAERLPAAAVTRGFFATLGVEPALGSGFALVPAGEPAVMLGDGLWRRRFGADPEVVGRTLTLDGVGHRVAGVLPAGFRFAPVSDAEIWTLGAQGLPEPPIDREAPLSELRDMHYFQVIGRLAPGVGFERAAAETVALARRYAATYPQDEGGRGMRVLPFRDKLVGDLRPALLLLLAAVAGVLLIACGNVSGLLLARSVARGRELAVRSSLGAAPGRLVRQALVEGGVLAAAGGAGGLLLGAWGVDGLVALAPPGVTRLGEVGLDGRVLAFTAALALTSVVLFNLVPALRASRPALREALLEGGVRSGTGRGSTRLRAGLVIAETALALVLLVGAGLLLRSLLSLRAVDPGFRPGGVLTLFLSLPAADYPDDQRIAAVWEELETRLAALPGVESAGQVLTLPFSGNDASLDFHLEDRPTAPGEEPNAGLQVATGGYFEAIGIPLLDGRVFTAADHADAPLVAVVNQAFARRFLGGENPVGRRLNTADPAEGEPWFEIVGLVGDVRHLDFAASPRPEVYLPYRQLPWRNTYFVLRTAGDPAAVAAVARRTVAEVDPDLPVIRLAPLADYLVASTAQQRFLAVLVGLFAGLAAVLAAIGLYGVIAYGVAQRRREIGIRMALGARRGSVLGSVIGRGLSYAGVGVVLGGLGALALTRLLAGQLYGVGTADPATYIACSALLVTVAVIASWVPARRAAEVAPAIALRSD